MGLLIEDLPSDAKKIGLTKEAIQAAVESRLRSSRLYTDDKLGPYLYIRVGVVSNAFSFNLEYLKRVYDPFSDSTFSATTWDRTVIGTHGGNPGYILSAMSETMDYFLLEFLRVNEDACEKRFSPPSSQERE